MQTLTACRLAGGRFVAIIGLACLALAGCDVPSADGPANRFGVDFSVPPDAPHNGAIIFIIDGVNADTFSDLMARGELPTIKKYFVDRGLYVSHAVSSHPSLTIDNLTSITTGRFPGHHGIVAAKWFDRNRLLFRNYETLENKNALDCDYDAPTIFQQFPDRTTFSLFLQPHKGVTKWYENVLSAGPPVAFGWYDFIDRITLWRFNEAMAVARESHDFPAVSAAYLLAVNFQAYASCASSEQYRQALRETDRQIGRVLGDLERAGMLDKIVIALVSDHGHCDTPRHAPIQKFVQDLGVSVVAPDPTSESQAIESRVKEFGRYAAVSYGAGDRYWSLYLRRPIRKDGHAAGLEPWLRRPLPADIRSYPTSGGREIDLAGEINRQEYVDAVAYATGPGQVRVLRKGGEVEFTRIPAESGQPNGVNDPMIRYRLISGSDPLGWARNVPADALAGKPMTSRQWLEATTDTEFPDLATGLLSFFDGRLAADLVVFPSPTWDFDGWRLAGHGGIRGCEMHMPLMLAGPGVPHVELKTARNVDLMPTLLQVLGKPLPAGLDGQSLILAPKGK